MEEGLVDGGSQHSGETPVQDLFHEEAAHQHGKSHKPWWKSQFFVIEPVLFGTWDGVFTSCLINIFGVVLFLRTGWMVGNVGIGLAVLIVMITITVAALASLSAIGICERVKDMGTGGVYYLVSKVLGGKIGGTIGVMYAFGLCVVSALYCTGFAESVTKTFHWDNEWAVRGVAIGTLLCLLAINLAGVKWVIRLQLLLLLVLIVSTSDFIIGTFVHTDPGAGYVGYSPQVLHNNTGPSLQVGETFFTVFGVFFPTATGVMAGVNMSGDLKNPAKSIPVGTLSAIMISFILYLVFVLLLGSTCTRIALQTDFMIAEKVSAVGVLWLIGIYMSSTSSCSTGLYGAPRVLQSIANENVIPAIRFMGKGFGANKTPVIAICVVGLVSLLFIFIGNLNLISPVITCNFMLVYASVDYSYFALAMSYDKRIKNFSKYKESSSPNQRKASPRVRHVSYGSNEIRPGTMDEFTKDLDTMEKISKEKENETATATQKDTIQRTGREYLKQSYGLDENEKNVDQPDDNASDAVEATEEQTQYQTPTPLEPTEDEFVNQPEVDEDDSTNDSEHSDFNDMDEILQQPHSWYSFMCNRWSSLFAAFLSIVVMFLIHWVYALANILAFILIYLYTSLFSPGLNPGAAAHFSFVEWVKEVTSGWCNKKPPVPEQFVVTPMTTAPYTMVPTQLTVDNEDFANRGRFHQSAVGDYDYASLATENKPLLMNGSRKHSN
uniref:solute carrier family 12 member 8-like isoform X1 n=1 Tax=Ciona intestinalis TaxID=7719 RepID=UPI000180BB97|nr:solute carrier family 12 member 8-like isoform X1 [Ciona intestinalis]|eukprot:XP_002119745.1 solute carrier family 12 member 8-like isoform X1 [Ciona intestinalis]